MEPWRICRRFVADSHDLLGQDPDPHYKDADPQTQKHASMNIEHIPSSFPFVHEKCYNTWLRHTWVFASIEKLKKNLLSLRVLFRKRYNETQ
jgi:hypothetical protein